MNEPVEGELAPDFELPDASGEKIRLSGLRGRPVVLYFYPKDDTPGCTREACEFRDLHANFEAGGILVLGISPDTPSSHARFAGRHDLPFRLLADEDRQVCRAYGVWREKSMYGRKYMGVQRSTFLIDAAGRLAKIWRQVRPAGHAAAVLQAAATCVSNDAGEPGARAGGTAPAPASSAPVETRIPE